MRDLGKRSILWTVGEKIEGNIYLGINRTRAALAIYSSSEWGSSEEISIASTSTGVRAARLPFLSTRRGVAFWCGNVSLLLDALRRTSGAGRVAALAADVALPDALAVEEPAVRLNVGMGHLTNQPRPPRRLTRRCPICRYRYPGGKSSADLGPGVQNSPTRYRSPGS